MASSQQRRQRGQGHKSRQTCSGAAAKAFCGRAVPLSWQTPGYGLCLALAVSSPCLFNNHVWWSSPSAMADLSVPRRVWK